MDANEPVGMAAAADPRLRAALESLGIDYVCSGDRNLADAAAAEGLSVRTVQQEMDKNTVEEPPQVSLDGSLSDLVDHLTDRHHTIGNLFAHTAMLFDLLPDRKMTERESFHALRSAFQHLATRIYFHEEHEQQVLFPLIVAMECAWTKGTVPPPPIEGGLRRSLAAVYMEHDEINKALKLLRTIRTATRCQQSHSQCRTLQKKIARLERHLHEAMNLENFVLFPRAIALEDEMYVPQASGAAV